MSVLGFRIFMSCTEHLRQVIRSCGRGPRLCGEGAQVVLGSELGAACRQILGSLAVAQFIALSLEDSPFSPVTT